MRRDADSAMGLSVASSCQHQIYKLMCAGGVNGLEGGKAFFLFLLFMQKLEMMSFLFHR